MKSLKTKSLLVVLAVSLSAAAMSGAAQAAVTQSGLDRLCYVKAEYAPVAYKAEASRYGVSQRELKRAERELTCKSGVLLGQVENNWVKRNPNMVQRSI